jgi:hypothetical protein
MRKGIMSSLLLIALLLWSGMLFADDCASQNLFFPLGNGFSWNYKGISHQFTISSRVTCTMADSPPLAGQLIEEFSGFPTSLTYTTSVKVENGAVYSVEPTKQGKAPDLGISGSVSDKSGQFQLYLPAMDQISKGVAWNRIGREIYSADTPVGRIAVEGTYQQKNAARVIGTEKISVPAGTFTALKVQAAYDIRVPGYTDSYVFIRWFAPGVGLVKEMTADGTTIKELTAYHVTPCCGFVVTSAGGDAQINGKPAASGMGGSEEAHLVVPMGSTMDLAMGDGSLLKLRHGVDAQMKVFCTKTIQDRTVIDIIRGVIDATITKTFTPNPRILINTPTCVAGDRGTEFTVEVKEEAGRVQTIIEVMSGEVWVQRKSDNQEVILQAGAKQVFE